MLFSNNDRYTYANSPLIETICQLRFPTILSIGSTVPAQFQEQVRSDFPRYVAREEQQPPKLVNGKLEQVPPITNYNFISTDGLWKINLTQNFIALSTLRYGHWEEFAQKLDKILALFIQIYQPAFFERIGLRYVNIFSRRALELEGEPWRELIAAPYLGILAEEDVDESAARKCSVDVEMNLDSTCRVKLHASPGMVKQNVPNAPQDPEVKFILDMDLFMGGQIDPRMAAGGLETLHGHSTPLFQGAITDKLHTALEPR